MLDEMKNSIAKSLAKAAGVSQKSARESLQPQQGKFGDMASTLAFTLAKEKKDNPAKLAAQIAEKMQGNLPDGVSGVQAAGPYLNFTFSDFFWLSLVSHVASNPDFGRGEKQSGKVLIEFPSVNPNKPWHVGHLRNALLGDSIARILSFAGYDVEREDYIDDLGLQVAQSVWGIDNLPKPQEGKFDHVLGAQYVEVAKRLADPAVEAQVREIIHDLETGSSILCKNARATVEKCVAAQYETSFAYGIYHDVLVFESDIVRTIFQEGLAKLKSSGAIRHEADGKNAGCWVVPLEGAEGFTGMENADKVLIRSDGTATYTGKDLVFQLWKFGKLSGEFRFVPFLKQPNGQTAYMTSNLGPAMRFGGASRVINVIGVEQEYPQKVLKVVLSRLGFEEESKNSIHLSYDHVVLPEGRFSGRAGTWMAGAEAGSRGFTADELLDEGQSRAIEKIKGDWQQAEKEQISRAVSIAAIRFSFLRTTSEKKIVFDWEKALSFEGDSGPYVQYAFARCCRILEKAQGIEGAVPAIYQFSEDEKQLLRQMLLLPLVVQSCAASHQAHPCADYALELAGRFSKFYATTPVLAEGVSSEQRAVRLAEVAAVKNALNCAMSLLGLPAIGRM